MKKTDTFIELGFQPYGPRPHFSSFALVRVPDGWTVLRTEMRGNTAHEVKSLCPPTFKAHAIERLKIELFHYMQNEAELQNSGKQA